MENPKIVVDALIDSGDKESAGATVQQMTIRRYAWLEKLESPFLDSTKQFTVNSTVPSLYVMCLPKDELKALKSSSKDKVIEDAFDWADDLDVDDVPELVKEVVAQLTAVNKAAPDSAEDTKKKQSQD